MGGLLVRNNALVVKDNRLMPADDAACCCEDLRYAVNFAECCDGSPVIWILETLVQACGTVMLGGTCYSRAGDRRLVSELQDAGVFVYLYWFGVCVPGCTSDQCRECPSDCCVYGFLPECERFGESPTPGQCCPLGALYRLTYTESYFVEVSGVAHVAACAAPGVPERCRGYSPGLVSRYTLTVAATEQWSGADRFGERCYDAESFAHTRTERRIQFATDGYTYPTDCEPGPLPINPRYETTDTSVNVPSPLFGRGVLPLPYYLFDRLEGSTSVYSCNTGNYTPYDPATCSQASESVESVYDCSGGQSVLSSDTALYTCCSTQGTELETITRIRGERRWTVEIVGRNGCEVNPCEGRRPGGLVAGGDDGRRPEGDSRPRGCRGCRGEAGL